MRRKVGFRAALITAAVLVAGCGDDPIEPLPSKFQFVAVGVLHSCGLVTDGVAYCWGSNQFGQLGDGSRKDRASPVPVVGTVRFETLTLGGGHTCGISTTGAAYCWGFNLNGQLGDRTHTDRTTPAPVDGGLTFIAINAGGSHTCALAADSTAYCWGWNANGQLGDSTKTDQAAPTAVRGGIKFRSISANSFHTCAVTSGDAGYCWGSNDFGQLGTGDALERLKPSAVQGGIALREIDAGFYHTCGLSTGDIGYCWGRNHFGQAGLGDSLAGQDQSTPVQMDGGISWASLSTGAYFSCGIEGGTGSGYCWGLNASGQLGADVAGQCSSDNGALYQCAFTPFPVTGGLSFASVSASTQHTCGLTQDGLAYCWGLGTEGQLGNGEKGSSVFTIQPVRVAGQP